MSHKNTAISPDPNNIPTHVAIIMDGNGRWAKKFGQFRLFGHKQGVSTVRNVIEASLDLGVEYLTLYTFSTENWNRPESEVHGIMELLVDTIRKETPNLVKMGVAVRPIGNLSQLPEKCNKQLALTVEATKHCTKMTLVIALSYSGRWDILAATKNLARKISNNEIELDDIDEATFSAELTTHEIPDPDLLIRTSGEVRISNFLLWEIAYSEIYFSNVLWPEFTKKDYIDAILDYQKRERRFGKTSDQKITN